MRNLIIDGTEVTTISDFADANQISPATVSGWIKREALENENFKAFDQIGPTLVYSVVELMGIKTKYQRQAKPKPVEFDVFKAEQDRNLELCVENAALLADNDEKDNTITLLTANLNSLQADYDALVKKFDELTTQENYYKRELEQLQNSIISG